MNVRLELLTVSTVKISVFWDVDPCSLIDCDQHFRGTCCLHLEDRSSALKMEVAGLFKMLVMIHQATQHDIPEDSKFA
jgi:hypothetical protein